MTALTVRKSQSQRRLWKTESTQPERSRAAIIRSASAVVERHDLVDDAVPRRFEGANGQIRVALMRGRDHDKLHCGVGKGVIEVSKPAHPLAPVLHSLSADHDITRHDPIQLQAGLALDQRTMKRPASEPMTDHDR